MLHREHHSSVLLLRLAHGKASALDIELLEALEKELDIARDAGAVVLTGVGGIFSAGVDLYRVVDGGEAYAKAFFPLLVRVLRKLFMLAAPLVVACNGHAIAGGAIFLAAGDRRLMADGRGRVGVPELLVGVPFPALALEIVRFALGPRAQYLAYTGTTLLANEEKELGLVDEVVSAEELENVALKAAQQLAAIPREAFRLAKMQLRQPFLDAAERQTDADAAAMKLWCDAQTHAHIREYLAKTIKK
ncbi:MAG TPA: enoyl-CoA hydratase/isomerase family protein [Thermoanaerobaculia bacterium]|nr:enoyl-CoA hydratase/isomerase family protein [Thermoanaerobaculia bacterium]